jgi:hypothetical protein
VQLAPARYGACALRNNGEVTCWGTTGSQNAPLPTKVVGLSDAVEVRMGYDVGCARRVSGSVVCWGKNDKGGLGLDGLASGAVVKVPGTNVVGLESAIGITAGWNFGCAALTPSGVSCWGTNFHGTLGNGTLVQSTTAVAVLGL